MKVYVSSTVGTSTPGEYDMEPGQTVQELLDKVATSQSIDPSMIQLVRNGQALPQERTMKEIGIKSGEALKAMPAHAKGGC